MSEPREEDDNSPDGALWAEGYVAGVTAAKSEARRFGMFLGWVLGLVVAGSILVLKAAELGKNVPDPKSQCVNCQCAKGAK